MKRMSSRNGSALLIVLGMLSFMIVSAVGFAAYMRHARLPSSYLRRSASSRQLVKAAIAEAINKIDCAINNNPHPGVGNRQSGKLQNCWVNQVFRGTNAEARVSDTVTPLCLEALAYIPPPLVNEARYWSRRVFSSVWQPLGFDSGRYVWCALDVSDCFDVNRTQADVPRSSASNRRVSLSHIFENDAHTSPGTGATAWDKFLEKFRGTADEETLQFDLSGKNPLISLADFNLALGAQGSVGPFTSPFVEYIKGASTAGFYGTESLADEERIRNMAFVTDSLFLPVSPNAKTTDGKPIHDLSDAKYQPFTTAFLERESPPLSSFIIESKQAEIPSENDMNWKSRLSGLGRAALYDYLDPDHVPVSLAIPTTERVPMICGVEHVFIPSTFGIKRKYAQLVGGDEQDDPFPDGDQNPNAAGADNEVRTCKQSVYYHVSAEFAKTLLGGTVNALVCFPFNHTDSTDGTFTMDGRLSFFLTSGDAALRTNDSSNPYSLPQQIDDFSFDAEFGIFHVRLPDQTVDHFKNRAIKEEEDAVQLVDFKIPSPIVSSMADKLAQKDYALLRIDYEWKQVCTPQYSGAGGVRNGSEWLPKWANATAENGGLQVANAHCGLPATHWKDKSYQGVDPDLSTDSKVADLIRNNGSKALTLRAAVWLRMKDDNNKIVDLVPACLNDDVVQNGLGKPIPVMQQKATSNLGAAHPLMLFKTGVAFNFSKQDLEDLVTTPQNIAVTPKRAIVSDPRFNHAPEHWFVLDEALSVESWLKHNKVGTQERGTDIFMATSDAGYLQSRYEIAFLPRFTEDMSIGSGGEFGLYDPPDTSALTEIPETFDQTANRDLVWRTYDPLTKNADGGNAGDFADLPWRNEGTGQMVNPYSTSTNILMAAFANTPIDWKRASTNVVDGTEDFASMKAADFNKKYAFNEYSTGGKLLWDDLRKIAGRFRDEVSKDNGGTWEAAWDDLGWTSSRGEEDRICGFKLNSDSDLLWTTDRKFLYGFWRDCFAAKQQLFMIFARAEPMMMGGGSGSNGQVPPQLGARAMALVWRDPRKSKEGEGETGGAPAPHQTRILFYRQFD